MQGRDYRGWGVSGVWHHHPNRHSPDRSGGLVDEIFLTCLGSEAVGGLIGLMLTALQDSPTARHIHGPPGLNSLFQSSHSFFPIHLTTLHEFSSSSQSYNDEFLSITAIPTAPQHLSYIIAGPPTSGNFIKEKAMEMGVQRRLFQDIIRLGRVEIAGKVVKLEEIQTPAPPRFLVAVVSVPENGTVAEVQKVAAGISSFNSAFSLCSVYHFSPLSVLRDPIYQQIWENISEKTDHIIAHSDGISLEQVLPISEGAKRMRNSVLPTLFPRTKEEKGSHRLQWTSERHRVMFAPLFMKYFLLPYRIRGPETPLHTASDIETDLPSSTDPKSDTNSLTTTTPPFTANPPSDPDPPSPPSSPLTQAQPCTEGPPSATPVPATAPILEIPLPPSTSYFSLINPNIQGHDPLITFLGTGSSVPSRFRNVSSIYLSEWGGGLLLDCGEGCYWQLVSQLGLSGITPALQSLQAVIISHIHADHHLGLGRVIEERRKVTEKELMVVGPQAVKGYVEAMVGTQGWRFIEGKEGRLELEGLKEVKMVPVEHVHDSYGVVIEHQSGWKLVYSGDTRPSAALIASGQSATILIHETTFDDCFSATAVAKRHSTISEAVGVSVSMRAWRLILTHFSQRYKALPCVPPPKALIAFDNMQIRFSECEHCEIVAKALRGIVWGKT